VIRKVVLDFGDLMKMSVFDLLDCNIWKDLKRIFSKQISMLQDVEYVFPA